MNMFNKILRAREKQAQLSVHAHLATLDDVTLTRMGVNRQELKSGGRMNFFM